jgi:hypothetical protein
VRMSEVLGSQNAHVLHLRRSPMQRSPAVKYAGSPGSDVRRTAAGGRLAALPRLRSPPGGRLSDSPLPRERRSARAGRGGVRWEAMGRRERTSSALFPWLGMYRAP